MLRCHMRTTVTLDSDTEQAIRERMARDGVSFKRALNDAIRAGLGASRAPFRTRTLRMGPPDADLDKALALAGDLEDAALVAKMRRGA